LLVNPNATQAITEACSGLARGAASTETEVIAWTNREGPPIVDSFYADYAAGWALSRALPRVTPPPDAVVLAGFGNYGTAEVMDVPVVNIAEAAFAFALPFCHRFAVLTAPARMVPYTQDLISLLGVAGRCAAVHAVDLPPLDEGEPSPGSAVTAIVTAAEQVIGESGADLVVLGGARLSPYAARLRERVAALIVEPIACGVQLAAAAVRLALRPRRAGEFPAPPGFRHGR